LVPAAASAAFLMVLPAVPSSLFTTMFNPQRFPPQQALGPSVASSVAPPCTLPSVPQRPPFAKALVPQLATVPAGQGTKIFPGKPSLFLASIRSPVPGYLFQGWFPRFWFRGPWFFRVSPCSPSLGCRGAGIPPVISKLVATIVSKVFTAFACLLEAHAVADAPSFSLRSRSAGDSPRQTA
jgi:hypothetical protein